MLACKRALRWDFPGSAVAIPIIEYENTCFQDELATFLEKASIESIERFAAHTSKAGSFARESRGTVDPALVTQMLMTLLEANGRRAFPPILQKRVRDDVCGSGGDEPWRRCPFWLVLRVAVHRHLSITLGGDIGRIHYKFLICFTLSCFLGDCIGQIDLDLLVFLKTKLCRRLAKLEVEKDRAPNLSNHYKYWFAALEPDFRRSTIAATKQIDMTWEGFKKRIQRPILTLPKYADPRHLFLSLPSSKGYIQRVLSNPANRYDASPLVHLYKLPQDYQFSSTVEKAGLGFANRYFKLSEIEAEVEVELKGPISEAFGQATDMHYRQRCIEFASKIESYLSNIGDSYDSNPDAKSVMLLTVLELWMGMDACAAKIFPLLMDYNPGIPPDILDVLQLAQLNNMCRLRKIQNYLQGRLAACNASRMTIFNDPRKGCFGERYYNESGDASLQTLHRHIETAAERACVAKEREWREKTLE